MTALFIGKFILIWIIPSSNKTVCLYFPRLRLGKYSSPRSPVTSGMSYFAQFPSWAVNICIIPRQYFCDPRIGQKKFLWPPIQELLFLWPPPLYKNRSKLQWLILVCIFNKFGMELLAEPLVHLFFVSFLFVLTCPWMIKSVVHRLKSFAQDTAQAGRALAQCVPGGPEIWPLVRVRRGKHHLTLENF